MVMKSILNKRADSIPPEQPYHNFLVVRHNMTSLGSGDWINILWPFKIRNINKGTTYNSLENHLCIFIEEYLKKENQLLNEMDSGHCRLRRYKICFKEKNIKMKRK